MKWPWVSRRAYDDMRRQRVALETEIATNHVSLDTYELAMDTIRDLRESNRMWADHARRLERKEHGMTEVPREARPANHDPMPEALRDYIQSFGDSRTIKNNKAVAYQRHNSGESWEKIMADVVVPEEPRERIMGAEEPEEEEGENDEGTQEEDARRAETQEAQAGSGSG